MNQTWNANPMVGDLKMTIPPKFLHGIEQLEHLPLTAHRLMTELQNAEGVHISRMVNIIEYDQAAVSERVGLGSCGKAPAIHEVVPYRLPLAVLSLPCKALSSSGKFWAWPYYSVNQVHPITRSSRRLSS
jgi:hypothetical protein